MVERLNLKGVFEEDDEPPTRDLIEAPERPVVVSSGRADFGAPDIQVSKWIYGAAGVMSALWIAYWAMRLAYAVGLAISSGQPLAIDGGALASVAFFVFALAVIWLAALIGTKAVEMTSSAADLASAADRMMQPETTAAFEIATVGRAVQSKIDHLNEGLERALSRLAAAEDIIRHQAGVIEEAADDVERRAEAAAARIIAEREKLAEVGGQIEAHAETISRAVAKHASSAAEATSLAETQLHAVESKLAKRVEDLRDASAAAQTGVEQLSGVLSEHVDRLDQTAERAATQTDRALTIFEQRLSDLSETEKLFLEQNAQLEAIVEAHQALAKEIAERMDRHVLRIRETAETGLQEFESTARSASDAARNAADEFADHARLTADVGQSAAAGILAAVAAASEAADTAKSSADAATEALSAQEKTATETLEAATKNSEEMARRSAAAVHEVLSAATRARENAERGLQEFESRLTDLPDAAREKGESVRKELESHVGAFRSAVEDAFKEAEALERSFSERMKRNLEVLSTMSPPSPPAPDQAAAPVAEAPTKVEPAAPDIPDTPDAPDAEQTASIASVVDRANSVLEAAEKAATRPFAVVPEQKREADTTVAPSPARKEEMDRLQSLAKEIVAKRLKHVEQGATALTNGEDGEDRKKPADWRWRDILAAADDSPVSIDENEDDAGFKEKSDKIIRTLQEQSFELAKLLDGPQPRALIDRFLSGERNLFAEQLVAGDPEIFKTRVGNYMRESQSFSKMVRSYLADFDDLLEEAATRSDGDALMEAYLSSMPGRAYLALGSAVGYFA